jgi:hypothetical protein
MSDSNSTPNSEPSKERSEDSLLAELGELSGLGDLATDTTATAATTQPLDDALGDLSLLDEAMAEMDTGLEASSDDSGTPPISIEEQILADMGLTEPAAAATTPAASEIVSTDNDDIPVLTESVDVDTVMFDSANQPVGGEQTIPTLSDETNVSIGTDGTNEALSELEVLAQELSTAISEVIPADDSLPSQALSSEDVAEAEAAAIARMGLDQIGGEEPASTQVEVSEIVNEDEYQELIDSMETEPVVEVEIATEALLAAGVELDEASEIDTATEPAASETEELDMAAAMASEPQSEPAASPHAASDIAAPASSAAVPANSFTAELHTQLAKQIDILLVEAINNLSNELNHHLAQRMEGLLLGAVDEAMPRLMEELSQGLRSEVQKQVSGELPHIVNDMMGKLNQK